MQAYLAGISTDSISFTSKPQENYIYIFIQCPEFTEPAKAREIINKRGCWRVLKVKLAAPHG